MLQSWPCARFWILLAVAGLLGGATRARAQANDPNAGSDVVGRIIAPTSAVGFVGIPPTADREAIKGNLERLWSIALRTPALNPPKGFDLKPELTANGILPGPREPFIHVATGLFYWYTYMPPVGVRRLGVAMHAFYLTANFPSMVLADRWQADNEGAMYYEPREVRRVAGYPQYSNGMIAITNSPRPLWRPVARERALRRELAVARENLAAVEHATAAAAAVDPAAQLAAWLRDRPKRQREADKTYERTRQRDPQLAEKFRANFAASEEQTEKALRQLGERNWAQPPAVQARMQRQRQEAEACIGYLEGELARLSPTGRTTDAYVALPGRRPLPQAGCSALVEPDFPGAMRIVAVNPGFFNTTLPRTSLQLIVVDLTNFEKAGGSVISSGAKSPWRHDRYVSLREGIDYKALASLLARP